MSDCIIWTKSLRENGHGQAWDGQRVVKAHRLAYEQAKGPVPAGLDLDHLCRNRACVNVEHLEPVTRAENARRGAATKLNVEAVRSIRRRVAGGEKQCDLAQEFGVAACTITNIVAGRSWHDIYMEDLLSND